VRAQLQADAVDLGMPGMLPVLNEEAVRYRRQVWAGYRRRIGERSVFDRKNYFYPDLPKGYQVSQFFAPIVCEGSLRSLCRWVAFPIRITRAHLEEDAGKSVHDIFPRETGIDLNRAGTPLLEIVTEPDFRIAEQAVAYLKALHSLVTYLGISDGNMAEGSMRCDINISLAGKRAPTHWAHVPRSKTSTPSVLSSAPFTLNTSDRPIFLIAAVASFRKRGFTMLSKMSRAQCAPKKSLTTIATFPNPTSCPSS
jgi:Asp-tRNA(Asn)/Glu-tRNA(Gln) amidotransferase B subunit